jgi:hypothetical protein
MTFQLPWNRKKTTRVAGIELPHIELPRIELPRIDGKQIERATASLPKIETSKLPEVSAASVGAAVDDAKRAIGGSAEQVAQKATQLGQDAGKLSRDLAASSGSSIRSLGTDLRGLTRDLRSLRITRQKQGPDMMPGIFLLAGIGSGMAAMYFFDPEQGRRRRALLRDQVTKWTRVASETFSGRAEDLRNRSIGLAHEARTAVSNVAGSASTVIEDTRSSIVDTTPSAASDLEMTDAAARAYSDESVYSTSEPQSVSSGELGTEEGSDREQIYSAYRDTGRDN